MVNNNSYVYIDNKGYSVPKYDIGESKYATSDRKKSSNNYKEWPMPEHLDRLEAQNILHDLYAIALLKCGRFAEFQNILELGSRHSISPKDRQGITDTQKIGNEQFNRKHKNLLSDLEKSIIKELISKFGRDKFDNFINDENLCVEHYSIDNKYVIDKASSFFEENYLGTKGNMSKDNIKSSNLKALMPFIEKHPQLFINKLKIEKDSPRSAPETGEMIKGAMNLISEDKFNDLYDLRVDRGDTFVKLIVDNRWLAGFGRKTQYEKSLTKVVCKNHDIKIPDPHKFQDCIRFKEEIRSKLSDPDIKEWLNAVNTKKPKKAILNDTQVLNSNSPRKDISQDTKLNDAIKKMRYLGYSEQEAKEKLSDKIIENALR